MNTITDDQIAEIEYLASNATGGDWEFHICEIRANYDSEGYTVIAESPSVPKNWRDQRDTNMRYMATVCPAVAQALITRLREAERDAARLEWLIGEQCIVESQNCMGRPVVYRLFWRHLGECQAEWYPSERAAIDAAMQESEQ